MTGVQTCALPISSSKRQQQTPAATASSSRQWQRVFFRGVFQPSTAKYFGSPNWDFGPRMPIGRPGGPRRRFFRGVFQPSTAKYFRSPHRQIGPPGCLYGSQAAGTGTGAARPVGGGRGYARAGAGRQRIAFLKDRQHTRNTFAATVCCNRLLQPPAATVCCNRLLQPFAATVCATVCCNRLLQPFAATDRKSVV